jgi:ubiquinol-cytochrome c reductase iron-sulfur subunit
VDHRQEAEEAEELMSDETNETTGAGPERVIGTPPPVKSGALLASGGGETEEYKPGTELDERSAKKAERIVALCFLIAFAASVGFIVYFIGWSGRDGGMHGLERARESNFWLGGLMALSFLMMGTGVTLWMRRLMTSAPIEQARYDLSTDEETRSSLAQDIKQGALDSGLGKRPLLRRTLLLAAAPLGLAPLVLLRDLGPLPE